MSTLYGPNHNIPVHPESIEDNKVEQPEIRKEDLTDRLIIVSNQCHGLTVAELREFKERVNKLIGLKITVRELCDDIDNTIALK